MSFNLYYFIFYLESELSNILKYKPDLIDQLALSLDRKMRLIPNWKQLAQELMVHEAVISRLDQYSDYSPTIRLFEYLEVTQPNLTIRELRQALTEISRNDLNLLTTKGNHIYTCSE